MKYEIQRILKWSKQFDGKKLVLRTQSKEYNLFFNELSIPHLLGLHYCFKNDRFMHGYEIKSRLSGRSDEQIYMMIKKRLGFKFTRDIKNRVINFKEFMKKLHDTTLVEKTSKTTRIRADHVFIKKHNGSEYMQLFLNDSHQNDIFMESFVVNDTTKYFDKTKIQDKMLEILEIKDEQKIPFSFDKTKDKLLKRTNLSISDEDYNHLLQEVDFNQIPGFEFKNFHFYPIGHLTRADNYSIKNNLQWIDTNDGLSIDQFKSIEPGLKLVDAKEFNQMIMNAARKQLGTMYHNETTLYCAECRSLYALTDYGMFKFNKYNGKENQINLSTYLSIHLSERYKDIRQELLTALATDETKVVMDKLLNKKKTITQLKQQAKIRSQSQRRASPIRHHKHKGLIK